MNEYEKNYKWSFQDLNLERGGHNQLKMLSAENRKEGFGDFCQLFCFGGLSTKTYIFKNTKKLKKSWKFRDLNPGWGGVEVGRG